MNSLPQAAIRVALYARVSTEDQADQGTIEAQRHFLANYLELYRQTPSPFEVAGWYVDDGISGTIPLDGRPEGRRLIEDARGHKFEVVLVYRLDRLGRSLAALLDAHAALEACGVTIRSATEPFDTATPIGKFLFQLLGSLAELERSTINERMSLGRDRHARDGKWTAGPIPFGYDVDGDRRLIPSARPLDGLGLTEAEVARSIFERLSEGSTLIAECRRLNALGVPTLRRYTNGTEATKAAAWQESRLQQMVKNSVYRGTHVVESATGGLIEREVPGLVDRETWERAQAQLTRNRQLSKRGAKRDYLLRGLVRCGQCGASFVGAPSARGGGGYYRCNYKTAHLLPAPGNRCPAKVVSAEWLEDLVWRDCAEFVRNPGDALAEAQEQLRERLGRSAGLEQQRRRIEGLLAEKEAERERVMTMYRRGRIALDQADRQLDDVNREEGELRAQLEGLRAEVDLVEAFGAQVAEATALLGRLQDQLDEIERTNDRLRKRQIVEYLVSGIRVDTAGEGRKKRAKMTITYTFAPSHAVLSTNPR